MLLQLVPSFRWYWISCSISVTWCSLGTALKLCTSLGEQRALGGGVGLSLPSPITDFTAQNWEEQMPASLTSAFCRTSLAPGTLHCFPEHLFHQLWKWRQYLSMWVWWTFLLANLSEVHWNCEVSWVVVWKCESLKWCNPQAYVFVREEKY